MFNFEDLDVQRDTNDIYNSFVGIRENIETNKMTFYLPKGFEEFEVNYDSVKKLFFSSTDNGYLRIIVGIRSVVIRVETFSSFGASVMTFARNREKQPLILQSIDSRCTRLFRLFRLLMQID